ncbi:telomere repeats-binding bouquet formation protein 2 [Eublepharis macularius]|uniref:Telomere repeats-binding bouquet formation protein 2 n=1 Tax=Eublepharis macularius TaxID=481883 RepID=A0AA97LK11_EUBMA|nr:telomere repeats-binding bouquet formation protein 2 [Eublepharis macularius]
MFGGCRGWFSQSVARELCDLWVAERGVITNQEEADYLFSSDAAHPDTKRIHESLDYLEDRIEVFHSNYLNASTNSEIKITVPLGHFLLPPACLQEEIRKQIGSFIWEQITEPLKPQSSDEARCGKNDQEPNGTSGLDKSEGYQTPETSERMSLAYVPLQDYPSCNMVTGYDSAKEMKKFLGEIRDFVPGCSGYLAYCIQNETSFFSDRKPKLKRKL